MPLALALFSAAAYGVGDFLGGVSARRVDALRVTLVAELSGIPLVLLALPMFGVERVTAADLAWGAAAGIAGSSALTIFFAAMSSGSMAVAAPVAAVLGASIPVVVGVVGGDRPGVAPAVGVMLAVVAVVLLSVETGGGALLGAKRTVGLAALAGTGFGIYLACYSRASPAAGLTPVLIARLAGSLPIAACLAMRGRGGNRRAGPVPRLAFASGLFDVSGNILYVLALRGALLSLVAVVASLYPAFTVLLAWRVLGERLRPTQLAGAACAAVAVMLIAI